MSTEELAIVSETLALLREARVRIIRDKDGTQDVAWSKLYNAAARFEAEVREWLKPTKEAA
jgi:hypothetical protein